MWFRTRWTTRSVTARGRCSRSSSRPRELGTHGVVAAERPVVDRRRLADVVQERRPPDHRVAGRRGIHGPQRVVEQVLALDLVLRRSRAARAISGRRTLEQARLLQQPKPDRRPRRREQLPQLGGDALARDVGGEGRVLADRGEGRRIDRELQDGRQPDGADHPQRVLAEPRRGLADGADAAAARRRRRRRTGRRSRAGVGAGRRRAPSAASGARRTPQAIAFTVKSRRARSSRTSSPNST